MPSPSPIHLSSRARITFLLILILVTLLRLHRLGAQSLWYDETVSVYLASKSLPALIAHTAGDIHPPGYYILLHLWLRLVGSRPGLEFLAAFPSLWFGVAIVALVIALARRLYDDKAAALAGLLAAVNPFHLWYSQEVRMYTLGAAFGLFCLWATLCLVSDGASPRCWWGAYVAAATLGLYTLYYFAFLLIVLNLWMLFQLRNPHARPRLGAWLLAQTAVVLLYGPWLPILWRQATEPPVPPWRTFTPLGQVLWESARALAVGQSFPSPVAALPTVLALALYGLGLMSLTRTRAALVLVYTWGAIFLLFLLSFITPLYHVRYTFTYAPLFLVAVGGGLAAIRPRAAALALLAALLASSAVSLRTFWYAPAYATDDHRAAVKFLAEHWRPGDVILVNAGYAYTAILTYWPGGVGWRGRLTDPAWQTMDPGQGVILLQTGTVDGPPTLGWGSPSSDFYAMPRTAAEAALNALFVRASRVWVYRIYDTVTDPEGTLRAWLATHCREFEDRLFAGEANLRVQGWLTNLSGVATMPQDATPIGITLGPALTLIGVESTRSPARAGEPLDVSLYWRAESPLSLDLATSLRLVGTDGENWAQVDEWPLGNLMLTSAWPSGEIVRQPVRLMIPEGTPPGEYELQLAVYDPATGVSLGAPEGPLSVPDVGLRLGKVAVVAAEGRACPSWPLPLATAGSIRLERAEVAHGPYRAGGHLPFLLTWRSCPARGAENGSYQVVARLRDQRGRVVAEAREPFVGGHYPSTSWPSGVEVQDRHALALPGNLESGTYRLTIGLAREGDGDVIIYRRSLWPVGEVEVARVKIEARPIVRTPPTPAYPLAVRLGEGVQLIGYDLDASQAHAGGMVSLTLYWHAVAPPGAGYKVFAHLLDPEGQLRGQRDGIPGSGVLPTSGWVPGEYVTDRYEIAVHEDAPPGTYHIAVGMYQEASGTRLPVFAADGTPLGDHVLLGPIEVR